MAAVTLPTHYRNVFAELGYAQAEIDARIENTFHTIFYGDEAHRFYHPTGPGLAYIEDTGNHDVRTEGMSYGMMLCVQTDHKAEFDALWSWVMHYMYMQDGPNAGYFAWSCQPDGTPNANGPAPDGEEYFAMALFFAAGRWGCGSGIYDYAAMARRILHSCLHKGEKPGTGRPMWDPENHLIKFITECDFTDPSYHLPHFYTLFSLWADEADRPFWAEAARASRAFLHKACHPVTGLCAEYSLYDGTPHNRSDHDQRHDLYYSDAYRTIANMALDYAWFGADPWQAENAERLQNFLRDAVRPHKRHLGDRWHTAARGGPAPRGHHGHQRPGEPGGGRPQRRGLRAPFLEHAPAGWPTPLLRQLPVLLCPAGSQRPIPHLAAVSVLI